MGQKAAVGCLQWQAGGSRRLLGGVVLLSIFLCKVGLAGTISLQTFGTVKVGDELTASAKVTNRGDESAYEVKPYFSLGMEKVAGSLLERLDPGQSHRWQVTIGKKPSKPGRYPVKLVVNYRDANGYPFSALVMLTAMVGEGEAGDVVVAAKPATLRPRGTMKVTVTNRGDEARALTLVVDTPREIVVEGAARKFLLGGGESRTLKVRLRSAGGLAGSSYAVFARVEYESAEKHYTEFIGTVAKVETGRAAPYRRWLLGAALILAAIALAMQLRRRRRAD